MSFRASISSSITIGLDKKPFMPQSNARFRSSSNTLVVMATIGTAARTGSSSARMRWVAVQPSITGICTSISTRS